MNFKDFLELNKISKNSANTYSSVIRCIERSEGVAIDLTNVDRIIREYSRGGAKFDPNDHANNTSALKWYRKYLHNLKFGESVSSGKYHVLTPQVYQDANGIKDRYSYIGEGHDSRYFIIDDLRQLLYKEINAIDGIRKQARKMTGKDSNPEYVEIVFEHRKTKTTDWFDNLCDFVNYANYRANNQFGELIGLVQHKINKEISQKNPRDTDIKHLISLLLY